MASGKTIFLGKRWFCASMLVPGRVKTMSVTSHRKLPIIDHVSCLLLPRVCLPADRGLTGRSKVKRPTGQGSSKRELGCFTLIPEQSSIKFAIRLELEAIALRLEAIATMSGVWKKPVEDTVRCVCPSSTRSSGPKAKVWSEIVRNVGRWKWQKARVIL